MPSGESEKDKIREMILGYGYILEESLKRAFKNKYPEKITFRPTIDVTDYNDKRREVPFQVGAPGAPSFFKADPDFKVGAWLRGEERSKNEIKK